MTPRERQCLRFIERYTAEHDGVPPSMQEIATELGLASKSGVARLVDSLIVQGKLCRTRGKTRSLEIVGLPPELIAMTDEALLAECARRGLLKVAA